jgi:hypothetical protein
MALTILNCMAMTLTKEDLQAIGGIVHDTVVGAINTLVPPMIEEAIKRLVPPMIEFAIEDLKLMIAAGFAEIDERFRDVYARLDRIELTIARIEKVQRAEINRVDSHERQLQTMRKHLHAV